MTTTYAPTATDQLEANKRLVRDLIDRIFVHQEDAAIDELVAEDFVPHTFGPMPPARSAAYCST